MIVVSDTSPLSALLKINEAELLVQLFSRVMVRLITEANVWLSPTSVEAALASLGE